MDKKTIEVTIDLDSLEFRIYRHQTDSMLLVNAIKRKLFEAGIPISDGDVRLVESGTIIRNDPPWDRDKIRYVWKA